MKKYFFLPIALLSTFFYSFNATDESTIALKTKNQVMNVVYNGTYKISENTFDLIFKIPKEESAVVEVANLTDRKMYESYLKNKSLDKLEPFKSGNALAVAINTISGVSKTLYISNDSRQVLMYEGQHFSSFKQADSTVSDYTLTHQVNYLHDFRGTANKKYTFNNFKDTLYCIAEMSVYKNKDWTSTRVVPFKLVFQK
jgi:hypothetical protein